MTTIAHVADLHLTDRYDDSRASLEEQLDLLLWIGRNAAAEGAVLMLVAGDVFDRNSTPEERVAALTVFGAWASLMPVVVVRGNHDKKWDLAYLGHIRTVHPIYIDEDPRIREVAGVVIASLPWPRKAGVVQWADTDSRPDTDDAARQAIQTILQGFATRFFDSTAPCVLLAHVEIGGARLDTGVQVLAHADLPLSAGDLLDTGADYCALGHIHRHQVLRDKLCYAGSTRQTTFGEDAIKGYCLVDVGRNLMPNIRHVQAPSRELVTLEGEWDEAMPGAPVFGPIRMPNVPDRAYRLAYEVSEDLREQARQGAEAVRKVLLENGAHYVKIDARVTTVHRVRSEEIRQARTTAEKLEAYWQVTAGRPARATTILDMLASLEIEVQS